MKKENIVIVLAVILIGLLAFYYLSTVTGEAIKEKNKTKEKNKDGREDENKFLRGAGNPLGTCIDSDGGLNYSIKGNATFIRNGTITDIKIDNCKKTIFTEKIYIREAYCDERRLFNKPVYKRHLCSSCEDGVCLED